MNRSRVSIGVLVLAFVACKTSEPPAPPIAFETCVTGWWLGDVTSPCPCEFVDNPECSQRDCRENFFEGYLDGGRYYTGIYTYSETSKTMSLVAESWSATYTATSAGVTVTPPGKIAAKKCDAQFLTKSYSSVVRASPTFARALDRATKNGTEKMFRGERAE
ncbi:MAG: hypothetical protein KF819_25060 [Labilithrix sp.]|nr:hypothetical protein [Labilithrix sp.]